MFLILNKSNKKKIILYVIYYAENGKWIAPKLKYTRGQLVEFFLISQKTRPPLCQRHYQEATKRKEN